MELLFRGTKDGMTSEIFHNKCDNKGPTLTLIRNIKGYIFGGYAPISWTSNTSYYINSPDSFLFTLTNIHNTEPTKFPSKNDNKELCHLCNYGPIFGNGRDLAIRGDFKNGEHWSDYPCTFKDILGKGKSIFTGNLDNNKNNFKLNEIEIFKVI